MRPRLARKLDPSQPSREFPSLAGKSVGEKNSFYMCALEEGGRGQACGGVCECTQAAHDPWEDDHIHTMGGWMEHVPSGSANPDVLISNPLYNPLNALMDLI